MTVNIPDLPDSVVAGYEAVARSLGVPLGDFLRSHLIEHAPTADTLPAEAGVTRAAMFALLREKIVASGIPLLSDEELRAEIRERRGLIAETNT